MGLRRVKVSYELLEAAYNFPANVRFVRIFDSNEDQHYRRSTAIIDVPWLSEVAEGALIPEVNVILHHDKDTEFKDKD